MSEFEAFYRSHLRLVSAMALARDANPCQAEDLTQETFLRAWRHFPQLAALDPPAQRAWLVRTLTHLAIDAVRRRQVASQYAPERPAPGLEPGDRAALRLDVTRALAALEETDRQIVVLRYFLEMNSREIGELLGIPEGTVRHRLAQCRRFLAECHSAWGPEGDRP
jgi:RNA polymerase sigma-70 factor (ECF subfamily)